MTVFCPTTEREVLVQVMSWIKQKLNKYSFLNIIFILCMVVATIYVYICMSHVIGYVMSFLTFFTVIFSFGYFGY